MAITIVLILNLNNILDNRILFLNAYLIPEVNPAYFVFSVFLMESLGILIRKIKFAAFISANTKYNFSKARKFMK